MGVWSVHKRVPDCISEMLDYINGGRLWRGRVKKIQGGRMKYSCWDSIVSDRVERQSPFVLSNTVPKATGTFGSLEASQWQPSSPAVIRG